MKASHRGRVRSKRSIFTIPNLLSLSRFPLFLLFSYWLSSGRTALCILVLLLMGVTDILDGYIARKMHMVTKEGRIFDHITDKIIWILLTYSLTVHRDLPLWFFLFVLIRETLTTMTGLLLFVLRGILGAPNFFGRVSGLFFSLTLVAFLLNFSFRFYLLYSTVLVIVITSLNYGRIYIPSLLSFLSPRKTKS